MKKNEHFDPKIITLSVSSNSCYLKLIRGIILQSALIMQFSEKLCKDITLAVDEAVTNIIKHSYDCAKDKEIIIKIILEENYIELNIQDFGKKVDPKTIKSRKLDDIRPGGLGVFFIKRIMDEVDYDVSGEEGTILKMIKYIPNKTTIDKSCKEAECKSS